MRVEKKEVLLLLAIIIIALAIRSWFFLENLNFTQDPASFATSALEIWQQKKPVLIGPPISFRLGARYLFQGPATFYYLLPFLLMAGFKPALASYFFTVVCVLMVIPLYFGAKWLTNKNKSWLLVIIYSLLPFYIDHSRFFWNPNFQFSLMPLLIFLVGWQKYQPKPVKLLLIFFLAGIMFQFHYQFVLTVIGLTIYYLISAKKNFWQIVFWLTAGLFLGILPLIIFELRNSFYNLQTLILFLQHYAEVFGKSETGFFANHYWLSNSLLLMLVGLALFKGRIKKQLIVFLFGTLLIFDVFYYLPWPIHEYGLSYNWQYKDDLRVYQIIKKEDLNNFNVTNLVWDNLSVSTKYFLKRDKVNIKYDDYYHNHYLFAVSDDSHFSKYQAYEIRNILPAKILKIWKINENYQLYLLKRQI